MSVFTAHFSFDCPRSPVLRGYTWWVAAVSGSTEPLSTEHRDERAFYVPGRMQVWGWSFFFSVALALYCVSGLSRISVNGGSSSLPCTGFELQWLTGCRVWSLELRLQQLWGPALAAPWQVESSQTRDRTPVPWIGGQIPVHCAIRDVQVCGFGHEFVFFFPVEVISLPIEGCCYLVASWTKKSPVFHRFCFHDEMLSHFKTA